MKRDHYANFAALRAAEREGIDFRIRVERRDSNVAVIAPHGGGIEPGSSEVAAAVAHGRYNLYCFEGLKRSDNRNLHVTSTHFDEPAGVSLVESCEFVIAMHGWSNTERAVYLGGLDLGLKDKIHAALASSAFRVLDTGIGHLDGKSPKNICNRGRRGRGAQIEMSRGLRDELLQSGGAGGNFEKFVVALRGAIASVAGH